MFPMDVQTNKFLLQMGRADGYANTPQSNRKEIAFTWTNVVEKKLDSSSTLRNRLWLS